MKFFIDTADVKEIRAAHAMGCVDGVTTNPSLLAKVGRGLEETIKEICSIIPGPVSAEGIRTNVTLVFSPNQALLCAKAGATYVSPFVGRLDDISQDGMEVVSHIIEIYRNYGFSTQVLVASVRSPIHVLTAARMGADVATIPLSVIQQLAQHPLTDIGIKKFLADWEKVPKK